MELNIKYLNIICTDLGGEGGHTLNINAENEICTLLGGVGGHILELDAINEIYSLVFGEFVPENVTFDLNTVSFDRTGIDFSKT